MVQKDELGKALHENDLPHKQGVQAGGVNSKSDAMAPKDRPIGNIGADAGRRED